MDTASIAELLDPFLRAPVQQNEDHNTEDQNIKQENSADPNITNNVCALSPAQLEHISIYIDILIRWNSRINLTAIRTPEEIVTRHFGESLFAASRLFPYSVSSVSPVVKDFDPPCSVADVGTGAGFPGLPLKIWNPALSLTLIESNHKKATFLREITRALTLTDVDIQITRAESIQAKFDVVTLRAVEHFEKILPIAAALVSPTGRLALLIAAPQVDIAHSLLPEFTCSPPTPIPNATSKVLLAASRRKSGK
jgi:16S rRNA (guanine527-N7)-methyltransferase